MLESRMCSRPWIGSESTPSRASRLATSVPVRSRSASPSAITSGGGAASEERIEICSPASLPGV